MIFNGKPLRGVTEADLVRLVQSGLAEHIYLEYKSALYSNNHDGRKESLLDVCMFANSQGGMLLLGIPEARDANGQPTGVPDAAAQIGLEIENPENVLQAYGARIDACIEERITVESHAIPVAPDRFVLALRIPLSAARPHSVRYEGHIYFPCRRERHRVNLDTTEIKDMAIRVTSQLERTETILDRTLTTIRRPQVVPTLNIGILPVYSREFDTDVGAEDVRLAFGLFHIRAERPVRANVTYGYEGLIRQTGQDTATLGRNSLVRTCSDLHGRMDGNTYSFYIAGVRP